MPEEELQNQTGITSFAQSQGLPTSVSLQNQTSPAIVSSTQAREQVEKDLSLINQPLAPSGLQAIPGETYEQYQTRLGQKQEGVGTGFGTPISPNPAQQGVSAAEAEAELKRDQANRALQAGDMTAFNDFVTEYKNSLAKRDEFRQQLISSLTPSTEERSLKEQLAEFRKQSLEAIEFERTRPGVATQLATGRAAERTRQAQIEESNLIERIGIFQADRELSGKIAEVGLDSVLQDADSAAKIFELKTNYEDKLLERTRNWNKDKKDVLADVLENFQGFDPDKITPQMEAQITNALAPYGLSFAQAKPFLDAQWFGGELDRRVKEVGIQLNIASAQQKRKESAGGVDVSKFDIASPTYIEDLMASTAGGKKPNQVETIRPLQKALTVMSQLGELSTLIKNTKTDPILGTIRSMNPYDFDARAIQATLQATVPNLARGVYGEVGVLTDNDIRNYIKTLPNIKSTTEQNQFVTGMTLRSLQRGFESQLEILAAAGYDISQFSNVYQRMKSTSESIESELGIGGVPSEDTIKREFETLSSGGSLEATNFMAPVENFFSAFNSQLFQ